MLANLYKTKLSLMLLINPYDSLTNIQMSVVRHLKGDIVRHTIKKYEYSYHRRHVSGPHGECVPVDVMQKGGAVLA